MKLKTLFTRFMLVLAALFSVALAKADTPALPEGLPVTDGLSVFLDAEAVARDGDRVTTMLDRTGNENHAREVVDPPPRMPFVVESATPSGFNAVRFDGIGGYAEVASNPEDFDGRARTVFLVFNADDLTSSTYNAAGKLMNTAYTVIDSWEPPEAQPHARYRSSDIWLQSGGVFSVNVRNPAGTFLTAQTPQGSLVAGEYVVGVKEWKGNGDIFAHIRNAANETFSNDAIGGMAEPEGHIHTRFGAAAGGNRNTRPEGFFGGEIAAVLIYNRDLTFTERVDVEMYLHETYLAATSGKEDPGNPPVLDGLILHLNGMNVTTDGNVVTELIDLSGRENHALTYLHDPKPSLPVLVSNSTPSGAEAVRFDGVGGYAEITSNPTDFDGRAKTTVAVFRPEHLSSTEVITNTAYKILDPSLPIDEQSDLRTRVNWMQAFENNGAGLRISQRNISAGFTSTTTEKGSVKAGEFIIGINQWRENGDIASIVRNAANQRFESISGGSDAMPEGHISTLLGAALASGDVNSPVQFFEGDIAAFLIYNRELSSSELLQIEEYLYNVYFVDVSGSSEEPEPPITNGLVVHLNAKNVVADNENLVTKIIDVSGRSNDALSHVYTPVVEGGPSFVETGTPSGRPSVYFDGIIQHMDIASSPDHFDGRSKTTIVVFKATELGEGRIYNTAYTELDPGSSPNLRTRTSSMRAWHNGERLRVKNRGPAAEFVASATDVGSLSAGDFHIGINQWRDNGDVAAILINGAKERFESVAVGATANPTGHVFTRIGAGTGSGNTNPETYFHGEIAAVVIYNRELSNEELELTESYLHHRYFGETTGVTFVDWISGFGLHPEMMGPNDDASGDGVPNLLKFAIGIDPSISTLAGLPITIIEEINGNPFLVLRAQKNVNATNLNYIIEASTDLNLWSSNTEELDVLDEEEYIEARIPINSELGIKTFLRLRVELEN